jgi:hypothetical protein
MSYSRPVLQKSLTRKIKVEANAIKAIFNNSDRVEIRIVDVDCWLVHETGLKADRVVSKPGVVDIVVELKGKNINHAMEQVLATCSRWKSVPPFSKKIGALIVFSRSPERSATIGDWKARLLKEGIWLEMNKSNRAEYRFETFIGKKA